MWETVEHVPGDRALEIGSPAHLPRESRLPSAVGGSSTPGATCRLPPHEPAGSPVPVAGSSTSAPPASPVPASSSPATTTEASPSPLPPACPRTRLQGGIRKPKVYTDGSVRYGCFTFSGEPVHVMKLWLIKIGNMQWIWNMMP